jgi:hypothetical protein
MAQVKRCVATKWVSLGMPAKELRCEMTLVNGQCFGWKEAPGKKEWTGNTITVTL